MSDSIYRHDAIKAIETSRFLSDAIEKVMMLPTAQPDPNCSEFPNNSDTISRQAAIDAILAVTGNSSVRELYEHVQEHGLSEMWSGGVNAAIDIIIAVPPVHPEPCDDTISRKAAIDAVKHAWAKGLEPTQYIEDLPSAQPEHFADVSNMDDGELDFVQKHEKIPVELMVSSQPKPCEDAVSRQTLQKELALYPIDDITSEDEAGYNRAINDVQKMVLHLPSAQLEKAQLSGENATFDCISRQTVIDAIDDIESEVADGDGFQYAKWREYFCELPSAQPERTCVNCGRTVNNGGWYADGRTRCPIEEHYALPKDGYCHLWEKRNVTDDNYPERREE